MTPISTHKLLPLVLLALSLGAAAGPFDDIEARRAIVELRTRVEATQSAQGRLLAELQKSRDDAARFQGQALDLDSQLQALRAEQLRLRGQNEQLAKDLAEAQRSGREAQQAADERLRRLEPLKVTLDGKEFLAEPGERRDHENGLAAFRQGDYTSAQQSFADLLRHHPQTGYKASALFWQGNALYALQRCKEAVASLRGLVAFAPDHARVPEAKLTTANCELELNDSSAARQTLEELVRSHPRTEASASARDKLKALNTSAGKG